MNDLALDRSCGESDFMEDFSDMLLLKLLNTSITAADDNEKVCVCVCKVIQTQVTVYLYEGFSVKSIFDSFCFL